ncbi:MAG: 16S rRNA (cytosine(967)-C(5))-methyltransferase RsmB [Candidatus Hydrogenedentota bacterium]
MAADPVRDAAIDVLLRVYTRGAYLKEALDKSLRRRNLSDRGRRFLTQLVYGAVRHRLLCGHILQRLLHQPLEELPVPIRLVLEMGVYQALFCDNVTFPAMVHTSVELAKKRGHAGTAKLANAVLKKVPESLDDVALPSRDHEWREYLSVRYSLPLWMVQLWERDAAQGGELEALCQAMNEVAPVTVRTNTARITPRDLMAAFEKADCAPGKRTPVPEEITLESGLPPARSKRFAEGAYLIQDPASMLAAHLMEPERGERLLDLCAAPGGKTTHLAQLTESGAFIVALDNQPRKLARIRENQERLGLGGIRLICADAAHPPLEAPFDRVLLDAPCSGMGAMRRHPELKWRLDPEVSKRMGRLQTELLRSAVRRCKTGGRIVYSVCTFTSDETLHVVAPLCEEGLVEPEDGPQWLEQWRKEEGTYQTRPNRDGLDAFCLIRLRKVS